MNVDILRQYITKTKDDWNYITPIDFYNNYYLKKNNYLLIDLRDEKEYKKMHVKGSKNIYWLDILDETNLKKITKRQTHFF